jgi:hypothetical protein
MAHAEGTATAGEGPISIQTHWTFNSHFDIAEQESQSGTPKRRDFHLPLVASQSCKGRIGRPETKIRVGRVAEYEGEGGERTRQDQQS